MNNHITKNNGTALIKGVWEAPAWLLIWMLFAANFNLTKVFSGGVILAAALFVLPLAVVYTFVEYSYFQERVRHQSPTRLLKPRNWAVFISTAILLNVSWYYANKGQQPIVPILLESLALTRMIYFLFYRSLARAQRNQTGYNQH